MTRYSPCDTDGIECPLFKRCASEKLACRDFVRFVNDGITLDTGRKPSKEYYKLANGF